VVDVAKAVQRRGHQVVELAERARGAHGCGIVKARKRFELGQRFRLQRGEEVPRVEQAVEAAV
jgi:hypothetical protein